MIKVISSGVYASVQDLGRKGFQDLGVPSAGVMDTYAAKFANAILGNSESDAVIEITLGATQLEFTIDCIIVISGGDFSPRINNRPVAMNTVLKVAKRSFLSFGKRIYGVRTYVAVFGGCLTKIVLGSRSFSKGITPKIRLQKHDEIPMVKTQTKRNISNAKVKFNLTYMRNEALKAFKGPEYELLSKTQKGQLEHGEFSISSENNRMGYILEESFKNNLPAIHSSGVLPGTVQLTPSGKLIILMRDCQVTGGYPRILQLTESAINCLAQKTMSHSFKFVVNAFR